VVSVARCPPPSTKTTYLNRTRPPRRDGKCVGDVCLELEQASDDRHHHGVGARTVGADSTRVGIDRTTVWPPRSRIELVVGPWVTVLSALRPRHVSQWSGCDEVARKRRPAARIYIWFQKLHRASVLFGVRLVFHPGAFLRSLGHMFMWARPSHRPRRYFCR